MRCAILVPEWRTEDVFLAAFARSMGSYQEPSGALYIAASLLSAGHSVQYDDGALRSNDHMVQRMARFAPGFVGLSVVAPLWPSAKRLLQALRRVLPHATLAVGGPWPMATAARCLEECPALDVVFTCEGELASVDAVVALEAGRDLSGIPGLVWRSAAGEIVDNGYRPPIQDLDALPFPARQLMGRDIRRCTLPPGGYRAAPVTHVIGSRGCTNRCIFCFHYEREAVIRLRSAENIVDEVEECVRRFGFREVRFLDDNFTTDRERVFRFCDLLEARGLRIPWYVSSRIDTVDPEMLRRMKAAGCWAMLYGIESGVQKNLDTIGKQVTVEQVRQVVADTRAAGIEMFLPFMFGIPGETFDEALRTIDFAVELDPYYANFNAITPFPGTWLWEHGSRLGELCLTPERLTFQGGAFVPNSMTREELELLRQRAFRRFYSRPGFMLRWLRGASNRHVVSAILRGVPSFAALWLDQGAFRSGR
jgi:anaerobic magnesium-protoporphyrin IX monomethyl ester cyclase